MRGAVAHGPGGDGKATGDGRDQRDEGVVLLLVLVVILLTTFSVTAFGIQTTLEVKSARHRVMRVRAQMLAQSGVSLALRALMEDLNGTEGEPTATAETERDVWALIGREPIGVPGGGNLRLTVRDGGSRIKLNGLLDQNGKPYSQSRDFLVTALERVIDDMPGRSEEKLYDREEIADAILDWLDADDTSRLGDPEGRHHGGLEEDAKPLDRPIFSLGELASVPGVDAPLLEALSHYFTALPLFPPIETTGINPNTAPPHLLALIYSGGGAEQKRLLGDRPDAIVRVLRLRGEGRVFCEADREGCEGFAAEILSLGDSVFPPLQYQSNVFTIESEGRFGESRARVVTVVDRGDLLGGVPRTLYYRAD